MATPEPRREDDAMLSLRVSGAGAELREARERRGLSIEEVAEATRIPSRYLRALEEDAPIERFPAPVYARFFLREYARFLGVDDRPLVARFDEEHAEELEPRLEEIPVDRGEPPRRGRVLAGVSALALAALAVASLVRGGAPAPRAPPTQAPEPVRRIRVVLRASEPSWVHLVADGGIVRSETLAPGTVVRVRAERSVGIRFGNPDGVTLEVNGKAVDLERRIERYGSVFDLVLTLQDGVLHRRAGPDLGVLPSP
jgi:transcriptional regulator with XRE-family HTH domain